MERHSHTERLERIFVAGDGASWIRAGGEILPNAVYVPDRFYLSRYILSASGEDKRIQKAIRQAIKRSDFWEVGEVLKGVIKAAGNAARVKAMWRCWYYKRSNWDGITVYWMYSEAQGYSGEGHVSHILSARLSSRPGGWSKGGVESIAIMRVLKANGHDLREEYLAGVLKKLPKTKVYQEVLTEGRTKGRKAFSGEEGMANLPALRERESMVTKALRRIKSFCCIV